MLDEQKNKIDIFQEVNRDKGMEEVDAAINRITDNGENPGKLFPDHDLKLGAEISVRAQHFTGNMIDNLLDAFGGKVIDDYGRDTGYRSPNQIKAEKAKIEAQSLKSLLEVPEPENTVKNSVEAPIATNSTILDAALEMINEKKSVIPVGVDKKPLISWQEYQKRIATEEEVRDWFTKWPEAQLGLVTGKVSGLAVVDVEKGFGDYAKLGLPETMVSRTGSGGYHLFYAYVDGVRNKARIKDAMGEVQEIDIRGEGGYVIIPPSSNVNGKYEWVKKVPALPGFPVEVFPAEKPVSPTGEYVSTIDYAVLEYPGFGAGQRNNEMTKYAGALLSRMTMDLWEAVAWPMFEQANTKNDPPLGAKELKDTWDSICRAEETQSFDRWDERRREKEKEKRLEMLDAIEGDDIVQLTTAADRIRSTNPQTYPTGFASFDNAMKGGFKEGDLVVVTGMSGHGKTTLGQTFTYHMISRELPVLWFSYEVSADVLDDKFKAMSVPNQYKVYVPEVTATGDMIWVENKIKEAIKKFKAKCIFVDLIDFLTPKNHRASDNETLVLKRVTTELKNIARENRVIMFVMAHVRKQKDDKKALTAQDIAHSSSIVQLSDYVFVIERLASKEKKTDDKMYDQRTGAELSARKAVEYSTTSQIRILKNRYTGMLITEYCALGTDERFHTDAPSVERAVESPSYFHN